MGAGETGIKHVLQQSGTTLAKKVNRFPSSRAIKFLLATTLALLASCTRSTRPEASTLEPATVAKPDFSGDVDANAILETGAVRMQLTSNQVFIAGGRTNDDAMPIYPVALLPLGLPDQQVCVRFVSNSDGTTSAVTALYGVDGCPAVTESVRPEFIAAAIDAVSRWDYFPSRRCTFRPGTPDEKKCNGPGSTVETIPVTLGYRFLFSAKGGAGTVQPAEVSH